ncbi:MAG: hypothetical protein U5M23_02195 [Marinagarivorans sp.]|nr:hypothetical protein [Marinagarivorans sp.]
MELPHKILEAGSDLFVDAFLVDGERWLFTSLWGSETTIQQFFARIELRDDENGLRHFTIRNPATGAEVRVSTADNKEMSKQTAKTPSHSIVGEICHCFIFNKALVQADRLAGNTFVFAMPGEADVDEARVWQAVKELSHIPLMDHWQSILIPLFFERNWMTPLRGLNTQAFKIFMDNEEFNALVSDLVKRRILTLDATPVIHEAPRVASRGPQIALL